MHSGDLPETQSMLSCVAGGLRRLTCIPLYVSEPSHQAVPAHHLPFMTVCMQCVCLMQQIFFMPA